jgi:hypothetical protein
MTQETPYRIAPSSLLDTLRPPRPEATLLGTVALGFLVLACTGLALLQCAIWFEVQPAAPGGVGWIGGLAALVVVLGLGARWSLRRVGLPGVGDAKSFRVLLPLAWAVTLGLVLWRAMTEDGGLVLPEAQRWVLGWMAEGPGRTSQVVVLAVACLVGAHLLPLALRVADLGGASPRGTKADPG